MWSILPSTNNNVLHKKTPGLHCLCSATAVYRQTDILLTGSDKQEAANVTDYIDS